MPFNAIFLVSDPMQKWRLLANFLLYLLPFLAGALYLGTRLPARRNKIFGRVYFADLVGLRPVRACRSCWRCISCTPDNLIVVPLLLWFARRRAVVRRRSATGAAALARRRRGACSIAGHFALPRLLGIPKLAVSDYKGVAYARKFPDGQRVYERASPFGYLEVYSSSYLHFAPGLSDNAAFNLPKMPANAYLGLYIDGEGPSGIIRDLPPSETAYFRYLPMIYPYLIKQAPDTFVVQFGGGISTAVALHSGSKRVTVAEGNPAMLHGVPRPTRACATSPATSSTTRRSRVIDYDGRLYLGHTTNRYDVIDLSLADSAGLSSPGGFAIVEKYAYTREAMSSYMRALKPGGVLSVTLWNKEEPPKSVLKLYATMAAAAREVDDGDIANRFFVVSTYLSTATVLYKRGGFTPEEIAKLREHTRAMSFDEIYYPGFEFDTAQTAQGPGGLPRPDLLRRRAADPTAMETKPDDKPPPATTEPRRDAPPSDRRRAGNARRVPATVMGQLAWHHLVHGGWDDDRRALRVRHPPAHQRPALFRRLRQAGRPAARHRPARTAAGRVGLPAAVGDARHRLRRRRCRWCCSR